MLYNVVYLEWLLHCAHAVSHTRFLVHLALFYRVTVGLRSLQKEFGNVVAVIIAGRMFFHMQDQQHQSTDRWDAF